MSRTFETALGLKDQVVVTIKDAAQRGTLLVLDAWCDPGEGLSEATAYRAADFPLPAFTIRPADTHVTGIVRFSTSIEGMYSSVHHVDEVPDRWGRQNSWSRFTFGGRRFVRKRQTIDGIAVDAVYEYTTTFPKPGSKTGKLEDDASQSKLFWFERPKNYTRSARDHWRAFAVRGLDTVLLEYLLVMTMFRLVVERAGTTASRSLIADQQEEEQEQVNQLTKTLVKSVISNLIGLLG